MILGALVLTATMVQVLGVTDDGALVAGDSQIRLAGVAITDRPGAKTLLEWTLLSRWVMVERKEDGSAFVYRSPDALFINRELVAQGFARPTSREVAPESHVIVTYLGRVDPPAAKLPALKKASPRGSGSGATRRPPGKPSRSRRRH
jgi:hypothetical protein